VVGIDAGCWRALGSLWRAAREDAPPLRAIRGQRAAWPGKRPHDPRRSRMTSDPPSLPSGATSSPSLTLRRPLTRREGTAAHAARGGERQCLFGPRRRAEAELLVGWKGGATSELTGALKRRSPAIRTDEDTVALVRRQTVYYPDDMIAGILNRQHRTAATGLPSIAGRVQSLRHHYHIARHVPGSDLHPRVSPREHAFDTRQSASQLGEWWSSASRSTWVVSSST